MPPVDKRVPLPSRSTDLERVAEPRSKRVSAPAPQALEIKSGVLAVPDIEALLAALPQDVVNWHMRDGEVVAIRDDQLRLPERPLLDETFDVARVGLWAERRVFANSRDFYLALLA